MGKLVLLHAVAINTWAAIRRKVQDDRGISVLAALILIVALAGIAAGVGLAIENAVTEQTENLP